MHSVNNQETTYMKLFLSFFLFASASVFADPVIPANLFLIPSGAGTIGTELSINFVISGVDDLYSWQADVDYTPATLSLVSFDEGSFLPGYGSTFFIPGTVDSTNGVIAATADTLIGSPNFAVGGGSLLTMVFQIKAAGIAVIAPNNVTLLDSNFNTIPVISASFGFEVPIDVGSGGPGTAPEPGALALVLAGGGLLLLLKRRFTSFVRS